MSDRACASSPDARAAGWNAVCRLDAIIPDTGVCALVGGRQVAVFRVGDQAYAIDNRDPFTGSQVLSRGLVVVRGGVLSVASPLHKQRIALATGEHVDDPAVRVATWPCRVRDGVIEVLG